MVTTNKITDAIKALARVTEAISAWLLWTRTLLASTKILGSPARAVPPIFLCDAAPAFG